MSMLKDVLDWFTVQKNDLLVTAIGTLIAAIVAVLAWVRGGTVPRRLWHWLKRSRPRIPHETLRIFPIRRYPLMSDQRCQGSDTHSQYPYCTASQSSHVW